MTVRTLPFLILYVYLILVGIANAQDVPYANIYSEAARLNDLRARSGYSHQSDPHTRPGSGYNYQSQMGFPAYPQGQPLDPRLMGQRFSEDIPAKEKPTPSSIEKMYAKRIIEPLEQFGYSLFNQSENTPFSAFQHEGSDKIEISRMPPGAVQDEFVLNSGDELDVVFSGQKYDHGTYRISSEGFLLLKDLPPIPAAGRTIGQLREHLKTLTSTLYNTEIHVSLASVRQINVLIVGHVKKPGRKNLTVFDTVFDGLMEVGGIEKTGSLRQIKLVRDGRSTMIDLYALLMYGTDPSDLQLRDGDRLIVPSIGPTIAVAGEVKRPGIYEILPRVQGMYHKPDQKSEKLSLNDVLSFGGGLLSPGDNRLLMLSVGSGGQEQVKELHDGFSPVFGDGAILMVSKADERRAGMVEVMGKSRISGLHALSESKSLAALLPSEDVLERDTYPLIGVIERWDPELLTQTWIDFPLRLVIQQQFDRQLQDGDIIHLFSNEQISALEETDENERAENTKPQRSTYYSDANYKGDLGSAYDDLRAEETEVEDEALTSFLRERSVFVRGAVRRPGAYPVAEGTSLEAVVGVAGGLSLEANTSNIELTSATQGEGYREDDRTGTRRFRINYKEQNPDNITVSAGDAVRVNQKFRKVEDQSVLVMGEVKNPGRYDLIPGDKLSDLIARAGGPTEQAYPEGAIFSRESERKAEENRFKAQAKAIKQAVASALRSDEQKVDAGKIAEARALADELSMAEGLGRITVEADPAVLKVSPELDMLLESGDRLYIPKRSLMVRVNGEVLSPASLQFRENKKPLEYIHEAGGFTFHADKDRTFVLYPNGSAQPLQVNAWNYNPIFVPPGSTIVIPRDPEPFDFIQNAKEVSQILSNLAVTAIFIDDVVNDR